MTVDFRYATFGEYDRISNFLDEHWAKDHVYVRMPELFEWTFGRTDLWDRDGYSFALVENKSEIVGILGGIPFVFNCLGRTSPGVWFVNYMVRPDYRRGSIAIRLLGMFNRAPYQANVAFGMNPRVVPIYQLLRWRIGGAIPRHFIVLPGAVARMVHLLRLTHPDWRADRAEACARFFTLADFPEAQIDSARALPPAWDHYEWPEIAARTVGAVRDSDYLCWRYLKHPCFEYRFVAVPEGDRTGLLVWRLETIRRAIPQGLEELDQIGRLVEFLPVSRANARDLLTQFRHDLLIADALGADYYGYHGESGTWLRELGFRQVEEHEDGEFIPSRFQPLEGNDRRLLSAALVRDEAPICSSDPGCLWYWTKSDADQDRPN